jgi:putative peptidoglycan lipid II flippase
VIIPFAVLLPLVARDVANVAYGWLAASDAYPDYARPLSLFGIALVFFTVHFLVLRGFYSLERTRTVFWIQCVIASVNITLALLLTGLAASSQVASALVLAYLGAYVVGATLSYLLLRHLLGGMGTRALAAFLVRLVGAVAGALLTGLALRYGVVELWPGGESKVRALVTLVLVGAGFATVYLALARALRIGEVTSVLQLVTSRLGRGRTA